MRKRMTIPYSGKQIAKLNNIEICYDTFGKDSDPAFLLIMGLGGQMVSWEEDFCREIASHGYFIIRFDNRDVGLSTKFDDAPVPDVISLMQGEAIDVPYKLIGK